MNALCRVSAHRIGDTLFVYVAFSRVILAEPTLRTDDVDRIVDAVNSFGGYMPKRAWYWSVGAANGTKPRKPDEFYNVAVRRICLVSKVCLVPTYEGARPLLLWDEAFERWVAHVRML